MDRINTAGRRTLICAALVLIVVLAYGLFK